MALQRRPPQVCTWLLLKVLGREGATALQHKLGGQYVRLPRYPDAEHPVAQVIGHEAALRLAAECEHHEVLNGDRRLWIGKHLILRERNATIMRLHDEGHGSRFIAMVCGLTQRQVRAIVTGRPTYRGPRSQ